MNATNLARRIRADLAELRHLDPVGYLAIRAGLDPAVPDQPIRVAIYDVAGGAADVEVVEVRLDEVRSMVEAMDGTARFVVDDGEPGVNGPHLLHEDGSWITLDPHDVEPYW